MSIARLPREMGIWLKCDGTGKEEGGCSQRVFTANVYASSNREHWAKEGWGRGLRKGYKRRDLCPSCMPKERALHAKQQAGWEAEKKRRDEVRKAKWAEKAEAKKAAAAAKPKKPRAKKFSTQDACAEYLPDPSPSAA